MNKKTILIISILILFIIGCTSVSTKKQTKEIEVRVGFNGLLLEFLKNTPPQKVFEGDTFPVVVKVRNNGAHHLRQEEKAILTLSYEKDYTKKIELLAGGNVQRLEQNSATFNLEGKSQINIKGEEEIVSYNIQAGKVDPQSEFHGSTVIATVCYPYTTILDSTVCVDTDVSGLRPGKKACKAQDLSFSSGQGAPIAVSKIEVNMMPAEVSEQNDPRRIKPQFLIFIENKGQGTAIKRNVVQEFCTKSSTFHENLNRVYVSAKLSNQELDCTPKEKETSQEMQALAKLKDKKELVRCTLKKEEGIDISLDPYLAPLRIELIYGYTQSISANYFIQKTAR